MNIYLISGLGADKRTFQKLKFPEHFNIVHLDWVKPIKGENLYEYSKRLSVQIDFHETFILIGVSFGGILVSEMMKFLKPKKAFIISSFKTNKFPWYFRVARFTRIYKIVPFKLLKSGNWLTYWFFGVKNADGKKVLGDILKDTDCEFLKWAVQQILNWSNTNSNESIFRIHGDRDRIIPIKYGSPNYVIKGGGHFMIYSNAKEVSGELNNHIG